MTASTLIYGFHAVTGKLRANPDSVQEIFIDGGRTDARMRELRGLGAVDVRHVRTEDNPADIFTKILSRQVFEKHRATILNLDARHAFDRSRQLAAATSASAAPRTSRFRVSESHG